MKKIGIGLLGFGTVGAGVVEGLLTNGDHLASRLGFRPELTHIADLDITSDRGVDVPDGLLTTDAESVIDDPDTHVIIELIGGTGIAKTLAIRALKLGKAVVTANKALLAKHGDELFDLAEAHNTEIYFGASVGGGIPIIRALREGLTANRIVSIHGILNGTCNYILTRMEVEGLAFQEALDEAQAQGYAEADPALDIDGFDTAHKALILSRLAFGFHPTLDAITVEGIRGLSEVDIQNGLDLGYRVKLLAVLKRDGDAVEVRVHPAMVPVDDMLASVSGVFNAVMVHGDLSGDTLYYGRGAGREPTASTVIADVGDACKNLMSNSPRRFPSVAGFVGAASASLLPPGDVQTRFYIRLALLDRPGTLAEITHVLGAHDVSIGSVVQDGVNAGDYVPVVIVTHTCTERDCAAALDAIAKLDVVGQEMVRIRIED
ncbi:MAG: homoserine dehydrogenase [Verrucomicrobia bacterium]|nr:homoserine dehydrogenase [Verrucomicrobiota bacterium]